jgi:hypothetical protein
MYTNRFALSAPAFAAKTSDEKPSKSRMDSPDVFWRDTL